MCVSGVCTYTPDGLSRSLANGEKLFGMQLNRRSPNGTQDAPHHQVRTGRRVTRQRQRRSHRGVFISRSAGDTPAYERSNNAWRHRDMSGPGGTRETAIHTACGCGFYSGWHCQGDRVRLLAVPAEPVYQRHLPTMFRMRCTTRREVGAEFGRGRARIGVTRDRPMPRRTQRSEGRAGGGVALRRLRLLRRPALSLVRADVGDARAHRNEADCIIAPGMTAFDEAHASSSGAISLNVGGVVRAAYALARPTRETTMLTSPIRTRNARSGRSVSSGS